MAFYPFSFSRISLFLFLFLLALVFWIISYCTPYMWDDYWLNFVIERNTDGSINYTTRFISSWDDLVTTWLSRREFLMNGRIADCFCSITQRLGGKELFSFLNTVAMLVNVALLSLLCFRRITLGSATIITAGLILLLPHIDCTVFWMAGACNYLWGSVLLLITLLCLQKINTAGKSQFPIILCGSIAGFCCGVWHEGLAAPLAGGMTAYWLIERIHGRKQSSGYLWILACSIAGTAICLSSPALWFRITGEIPNAEKGLLIQLCISLSIIISRGGIPLLIFLLLFLKKKPFHTPLGWMTLLFIGEAIATCNTGATGGSFYYMSIAILIISLQSTAIWWQKREKICTIVLLPLIGAACTYEYLHMREIGETFRSAFTLPKDHGVCVVDWPEEKGEVPWFLYRSLPVLRSEMPYFYLDKLFGHGNFYVIFRRENLGIELYEKEFHGLDENKAHAVQWKGRHIIRLPKDWFLTERKIWLHSSELGEIQLREEPWWFSSRLYHHVKGDLLGNYTSDGRNGFRYIILPSFITNWNTIILKLSKEHAFTSKEKGGYQEIILHHP